MRDRLFSVNKRLSAVMMFFLLSFPLYSYANAGLPMTVEMDIRLEIITRTKRIWTIVIMP